VSQRLGLSSSSHPRFTASRHLRVSLSPSLFILPPFHRSTHESCRKRCRKRVAKVNASFFSNGKAGCAFPLRLRAIRSWKAFSLISSSLHLRVSPSPGLFLSLNWLFPFRNPHSAIRNLKCFVISSSPFHRVSPSPCLPAEVLTQAGLPIFVSPSPSRLGHFWPIFDQGSCFQ
jgi:hypothetical protein